MNLLQHIRSDRTEKKKKEPFKQTLFNRIGGLVKAYALENSFLKEMDLFSGGLPGERPVPYRMREKPRTGHSLFPLLTEDEYRVTSEIIKRADNSYLYFANSPEEILFCKPLFSHNSGIGTENLMRCHFKTLFLFELSKEKASDLAQQISQIREKEGEISLDEQKRIDALTAEIKQLEAFIAREKSALEDLC
jgi:hypothetical protein